MDIRTLQYWHKLEHFYPYILQEQNSENIKTNMVGKESCFPSFSQPQTTTGKVVRYYSVYLGIFSVEPALAALEDGIGCKMRFCDCGDDESCFCMFRLTSEGVFIPDSFQISSFPWAIHRVRDGKIHVDHWEDDFLQFQKEIFTYLDEQKEPVTYSFLCALRDLFAEKINWKINYCTNWMRIDTIFGAEKIDVEISEDLDEQEEINAENETTDEAVKKNNLLNSFFVRDLERIIDAMSTSSNQCCSPLQKYLEHRAQNSIDIETNSQVMFSLMSPQNLPLGRWPSNYGSRLMQQLDVNAFLTKDPMFSQQLFSVNGPPGTGKTTLLKDVVAAIVTDRADQLMTLASPNDAFESVSIGSVTVNGYKNRIWKLCPQFAQHGILVASSNNGAVENITSGLPLLADLPEKYRTTECNYFRGVSDLRHGQGKTWGLNAAALGKRSNCKKLADSLWPIDKKHEGYNFRVEMQKSSKVFNSEQWKMAKACFQQKREAVFREIEYIKAAYDTAAELRTMQKEIKKTQKCLQIKKEEYVEIHKQYVVSSDAVVRTERILSKLNNEIMEFRSLTPLLWLRVLVCPKDPVTKQYRKLQSEIADLLSKTLPELRKKERELDARCLEIENQINGYVDFLNEGQIQCVTLEGRLENFRVETGMPYRIDEYFSDCGAGEHGKTSPWGYTRLNELREQLFFAALELHRVFVQNSSRMCDNLDGFSKILRGMMNHVDACQYTAPLLQSFFLMVPVISTTFASVGTFLKYIPEEEIAYLFIDEAGQSVPQAAAGAIWRSRKVIAVGDPLQIEPVITLHDRVIELLSEYYQRDAILQDKYTSTQTLCDLSNQIGGWRGLLADNDLWVGAPLVVHSRCQYPVYDIANRIAYDNKMIFASERKDNSVCSWIKANGNTQTGHFVPAQAQTAMPHVIEAFRQYVKEKNTERKYPSIFVISPFRSVRAGFIQYFRKNLQTELSHQGITVTKDCLREWIKDCVGTIHTFQGKEANTVLLCLGVDSSGKGRGAVDWAGERPNILNVAVTRSKHKLYIIGDPDIWCRKSFFKVAFDICEDFSTSSMK